MANAQSGFTITEVVMFLAISGLLLVGAMAGVNANINNSRFNDAVRSTASFLQGQYNEVSTGRNDRGDLLSCNSATGDITSGGPSQPIGMTDCVVMGRLVKIQGSELTTRYITGNRTTLVGLSADDTLAINQMNPKVASQDTFAGEYQIPWEIGVINAKVTRGALTTPYTAMGFAIIRSPASGNVLYYSFGPVASETPPLEITTNNLNRQVSICFGDSGQRFGLITIENGQGQEVIQADLRNPRTDCT